MRDNPVTIPASGAKEFDCAGSTVLLCDGSSLPSFKVIIDGTKSFSFKEGRKYTHPMGTFNRVQIINEDAVNPLTVNMLVGAGDVSDNSVYVQSIQQIVQTVNVEDAPLLAETALVKAAVQDIKTSMTDGLTARSALTDFSAITVDGWNNSAVGTTKTLVTSAANVNGIIIRHAAIMASVNTSWIALKMDGDNILFVYANGATIDYLHNIYIPPGVELSLERSSAAAHINANVVYEVL